MFSTRNLDKYTEGGHLIYFSTFFYNKIIEKKIICISVKHYLQKYRNMVYTQLKIKH